ncbi:methylated-DNA--[protein]-cysteine S-methyltransferase [Antribacter gilvus]|uniref:methylated-DNA--[protein]-cysteine S-methyltransferase n=1 Tax=Antribacter gilvus TaxID=2304675 RepID=UPI000F77C3C5|nr:methylated-DNA--[protein]-cysteine S-methyltransferase [Antribacter gilvus]
MTALTTTFTTPDGPFSVIVDDVAVLAAGWTDDLASLVALVHPTLRPAEVPVAGGAGTSSGSLARSVLDDAAKAVEAYYAGDLAAPGRVPVRQASGPYRTHAWDVLREVGPGERLTYSEYAVRTGRPAAVRAAAGACARNAAALFVPCHRILRTDGTLGGFRYGLPVKERLLAREA